MLLRDQVIRALALAGWSLDRNADGIRLDRELDGGAILEGLDDRLSYLIAVIGEPGGVRIEITDANPEQVRNIVVIATDLVGLNRAIDRRKTLSRELRGDTADLKSRIVNAILIVLVARQDDGRGQGLAVVEIGFELQRCGQNETVGGLKRGGRCNAEEIDVFRLDIAAAHIAQFLVRDEASVGAKPEIGRGRDNGRSQRDRCKHGDAESQPGQMAPGPARPELCACLDMIFTPNGETRLVIF